MGIDYFVGDIVEFRGRGYFVAGIDSSKERPIALDHRLGTEMDDVPLDCGFVTSGDIRLLVEGDREYGAGHQKAKYGFYGVKSEILLSGGIGEPIDGVYPIVDEHGAVVFDHNGIEVDSSDSSWNYNDATETIGDGEVDNDRGDRPEWDYFLV